MSLRNSRYRSVAPALVEQRKAFRHPVVLHRATIRRRTALAHDAQLLDLSIYGCRVATDARFEANDRLWLRFEGSGPVAATAVWCNGNNIGCRFDAPIDKALFRALTLVSE
ncbi:MAG: PilZ domain-containing protein [Alphaproteobacteria bacterium]|nr:PilZ domain-containing protein [Alphaproteobacteria bacterium]